MPGLTPRPGSLKNPLSAGARPVTGLPPASRWRKRPRHCKRGWTSWRCCLSPPERQRQELGFRSALGAVLLAVKGQAPSETGQAYARARELWEQLGSPSEFLKAPCETVSASPVPRRIRFGASRRRGFVASKRSAERFRRARSGSFILRSNPVACRQVRAIPVPSGTGVCSL